MTIMPGLAEVFSVISHLEFQSEFFSYVFSRCVYI